jgi:hypothetical protein
VLEGRPVPYVTPVTAGHPWWRLTHGARLLRCQNDWCCQVCGLDLEPAGKREELHLMQHSSIRAERRFCWLTRRGLVWPRDG